MNRRGSQHSETVHKKRTFKRREFASEEEFQETLDIAEFSGYFRVITTTMCTDTKKGKVGWFERDYRFNGRLAGIDIVPEGRSGVYEIAIKSTDPDPAFHEFIPVYFGQTDDLRNRIVAKYGRDGSAIAHWLRPHIEKGFEVFFRTGFTREPSVVERRVLGVFDYAACTKLNPPDRSCIWQRRSFADGEVFVAENAPMTSCLRNITELDLLRQAHVLYLRAGIEDADDAEVEDYDVEEGEANDVDVMSLVDQFRRLSAEDQRLFQERMFL